MPRDYDYDYDNYDSNDGDASMGLPPLTPDWVERSRRARYQEEHRRNGELPKDWSSQDQRRRFVEHWMREGMLGNPLKVQIEICLRREDITWEQAVALMLEIPSREDRVFKECVGGLRLSDLTPEQQLFVMNNGRLVRAISEWEFRRIRDEVLENGDRRALGFAWIDAGGRHFKDREIVADFKQGAITTHCIEVIQELGDDSVAKADAFLSDRLRRGLGSELNMSYKTAEFLGACHVLGTGLFTPEQKAQLASEMIIKLVGHQSRDSREAGMDVTVRPQHQELQTLDYLIGIIAEQMTVENAGIILRWTMGRHRHHKWVWERIKDRFRMYKWDITTVERFRNGELGVSWRAGRCQIVVLPPDGSTEELGALEAGETRVLVPPDKLLGSPVETGPNWVLYEYPLHPLRPPTPQMREAFKRPTTS